jgi:molybdopterin converting factor small subunit
MGESQTGGERHGREPMTLVTLRAANHFRERLGFREAEFEFPGERLRDFVTELRRQFDVDDLLLEEGEIKPYVRIVIDGRYSSLLSGWDAVVPDGSTVVLLHSYVLAF